MSGRMIITVIRRWGNFIVKTKNCQTENLKITRIPLPLLRIPWETDPDNEQGTTSTTSLAVIFHVLQTALIYETGYKSEQFAVIHPGGAVGERLNGKNVEEDK